MKKHIFTLAVLSFVVPYVMANDLRTCALPGDLEHWQADYCMSLIGTDDVIAAQPCLEKEWKKVFQSTCAGKIHYKRLMCERSVKLNKTGSVKECVKDGAFQGPTVRNGGA